MRKSQTLVLIPVEAEKKFDTTVGAAAHNHESGESLNEYPQEGEEIAMKRILVVLPLLVAAGIMSWVAWKATKVEVPPQPTQAATSAVSTNSATPAPTATPLTGMDAVNAAVEEERCPENPPVFLEIPGCSIAQPLPAPPAGTSP